MCLGELPAPVSLVSLGKICRKRSGWSCCVCPGAWMHPESRLKADGGAGVCITPLVCPSPSDRSHYRQDSSSCACSGPCPWDLLFALTSGGECGVLEGGSVLLFKPLSLTGNMSDMSSNNTCNKSELLLAYAALVKDLKACWWNRKSLWFDSLPTQSAFFSLYIYCAWD